eukprot:TRINITY_DN27067_c0_g1_i3.p1 TRINITY_DN27067_c0_g1~~TRINITY_DN27067_c0_g1_i3.p1  ORF type:complete len:154 (-),score=18.51 TRINITY_DN27067_c0_g1_i3:219-680(-)
MKENKKNADVVLNQVPQPAQFLRRFMSQLGLQNEDMIAAAQFVDILCKEDKSSENLKPWEGKAPLSLAAATIYVISMLSKTRGLNITIEKVAETTGVAQATIQATYNSFYSHLSQLVPSFYASQSQIGQLPPPPPEQGSTPNGDQQQQQLTKT